MYVHFRNAIVLVGFTEFCAFYSRLFSLFSIAVDGGGS